MQLYFFPYTYEEDKLKQLLENFEDSPDLANDCYFFADHNSDGVKKVSEAVLNLDKPANGFYFYRDDGMSWCLYQGGKYIAGEGELA